MILCRKTEVHRWQELFMEMTSRDLQANRAERESSFTLVYLGHADVLNYLLQNFRRVRIDQCNHLGFTALMKAAIQGRTRCAKLLLFAGTWQFTTYIYLGWSYFFADQGIIKMKEGEWGSFVKNASWSLQSFPEIWCRTEQCSTQAPNLWFHTDWVSQALENCKHSSWWSPIVVISSNI